MFFFGLITRGDSPLHDVEVQLVDVDAERKLFPARVCCTFIWRCNAKPSAKCYDSLSHYSFPFIEQRKDV